MTRYLGTDGKVHIMWDGEDEPVDWTTPNVGDGIDDEYCGNCGWDSPGCGCPRDPHYDGSDPHSLPVQERDDMPIPAAGITCTKNVNAPCQNEAAEILWVRERGPLWNGQWQSYPRCTDHPAAGDVTMIARMHPMAETKTVPVPGPAADVTIKER